jgi:hypothetical protein
MPKAYWFDLREQVGRINETFGRPGASNPSRAADGATPSLIRIGHLLGRIAEKAGMTMPELAAELTTRKYKQTAVPPDGADSL